MPEKQMASVGEVKVKKSKKGLILKILMYGWPVIIILILAIVIGISMLTAK